MKWTLIPCVALAMLLGCTSSEEKPAPAPPAAPQAADQASTRQVTPTPQTSVKNVSGQVVMDGAKFGNAPVSKDGVKFGDAPVNNKDGTKPGSTDTKTVPGFGDPKTK